MDTLKDSLRHCKVCLKACTAAVEMLAVRLCFQTFNMPDSRFIIYQYKSNRIIKRLDQLPVIN